MMSDIEEDLPELVEVIKVGNESNSLERFPPENEHPVCDSINSVLNDCSSGKSEKQFENIDIHKPNTEESKALDSSYDNFKCKEEVGDEELSEILIKLETQNQQNDEEFSKNSKANEEIDISVNISQSREDEDKKFKLESQNDSEKQKLFTQRNSPDDDPLKQCKEKTNHSTTRDNSIVNKNAKTKNCQFCNKCFPRKWFLDDHILKHHKQEIKGDLLRCLLRSHKIHVCNICNSYQTTYKSHLDRHINSIHNEVKVKVKCQFCTESFTDKRSLDAHVLRKHKDKIKNDLKNFITCKIHICKICDSFETIHKSTLNKHINSVHNKVKIKMKCQFCSESFIGRRSLDEHILRKHRDKIKNDIKRFITRKIHMCKICNSYETTKKSTLDQHINSVHNEVKIKLKCNFCNKSFLFKNSLDGHVLRVHKEKIKNNIKSFITSKIHTCKICNSYETTHKSHLDQHIKSAHYKIK